MFFLLVAGMVTGGVLLGLSRSGGSWGENAFQMGVIFDILLGSVFF
jgi:hypothetical protein